MVRAPRTLAVVVVIFAVGGLPLAVRAQIDAPPTARVTMELTADAPTVLVPSPPPLPPPGQPCYVSYEDCNGPLLRGDPLLDRPGYPLPGWLAALDVGVVGPHVKNRLSAQVPLGGVTFPVHLPSAGLDWTGAPRLTVGYRFAEGFGEVLLTYRSLETDGSDLVRGLDVFDDGGFLKSRLDVNMVELDYASREFSLAPYWDMKWKTGVRFASVYFDSRAVGTFTALRTSNDFWGVGPDAGLSLSRLFPGTGLAAFGNIDLGVLLGKIKQRYEEDIAIGSIALAGERTVRQNQAVPVLNLQAGVSWVPPRSPRLRLSTGYEYEIWWSLGKAGDSSAELTDQGIFFRAELNF